MKRKVKLTQRPLLSQGKKALGDDIRATVWRWIAQLFYIANPFIITLAAGCAKVASAHKWDICVFRVGIGFMTSLFRRHRYQYIESLRHFLMCFNVCSAFRLLMLAFFHFFFRRQGAMTYQCPMQYPTYNHFCGKVSTITKRTILLADGKLITYISSFLFHFFFFSPFLLWLYYLILSFPIFSFFSLNFLLFFLHSVLHFCPCRKSS